MWITALPAPQAGAVSSGAGSIYEQVQFYTKTDGFDLK